MLSKNIKIRICKCIILPVVLYGCETLPLTLRGGTQTEDVSEQGALVLKKEPSFKQQTE
jgi:hypothetical protein